MSKTQLKKELARLSADQIAELVLDLYDARPEAKEYLDFYIRPDIDAKLDKTRRLINKEVTRASRGRSKMRSTKLRRLIKDISSLNPGQEPVCEILTFTIEAACEAGSRYWVKETTQRSIAKLMQEAVREADRAGLLDVYLPRIREAVESMSPSPHHSGYFKSQLREALADAIDQLP
ncbi:MAG: hypothetical protein HDS53_07620 [Barnesiella sp.]|nr:hypothetical protein [Barnesiella sp.]